MKFEIVLSVKPNIVSSAAPVSEPQNTAFPDGQAHICALRKSIVKNIENQALIVNLNLIIIDDFKGSLASLMMTIMTRK